MLSAFLLPLLLGSCRAVSVGQKLDTHPIEKVIGMLKELSAKAVAEGKEEEHSFGKFSHWCKTSVATVGKAIAEEQATIESLESIIEAKTKEVASLEEGIAGLEDEISKMEASLHKLEEDRSEEHAVYEAAAKDLEDTISAVEEAIDVMKKSKGEVALVQLTPTVRRGLAFAQLFAPEEHRGDLTALLQAPTGDKAKHVKVYKFKGGNVVELLKSLKGKFEQDLLEANKAETNAVNAYDLTVKSLENKKEAANASKKKKEDALAAAKSALAAAQAELKDAQEDLAADSATLQETQKTCAIKTSEWEERSETRAGEIEAIGMAVKILAEASGVRTEAPENPVPPPSPLAEAQVSAALSLLQVQNISPNKKEAVNFLLRKSKALHSRALERLAQEVAVHLKDPPKAFKKIIGKVQQMIFRLVDEQKSDDEHKWWCDKELEKTTTSLEDKQSKMEELATKIDEASAEIQKLTEEIAEATDTVAKVDSYLKEATEIREVGKKENALAVKDAEAAQTAIASAIAVLENFYKESGMIEKKPYEFLQQADKEPVELPEKPETWGSSYTGASDPKAQPDGIISVMEEVASDFSRMEAETKAQEQTDQKAYDEEMSELAIEKATRKKEIEMKTQESKRLTDKVEALEKTKKHVGDEHYATQQYMTSLMPACVMGDSTYATRSAARAKEIQALHEAQFFLENPEEASEERSATAGLTLKSAQQVKTCPTGEKITVSSAALESFDDCAELVKENGECGPIYMAAPGGHSASFLASQSSPTCSCCPALPKGSHTDSVAGGTVTGWQTTPSYELSPGWSTMMLTDPAPKASTCKREADACWAAMDTYYAAGGLWGQVRMTAFLSNFHYMMRSAFWTEAASWVVANTTTPGQAIISPMMWDQDYAGLWVKEGKCLMALRGSDSHIDTALLPNAYTPPGYQVYGDRPGAPNTLHWSDDEFHGLRVHHGVKVEFEALLAKIKSTGGFSMMKETCTKGLTVTGHSLGGATAQLMATLLNQKGDPLGAGLEVGHLYGFGPMPFVKGKPATNDQSEDGCFKGGMYFNAEKKDGETQVDPAWQMLTEGLEYRHVKTSHHMMFKPGDETVTPCGEDPPYPLTGKTVKGNMHPLHGMDLYGDNVGC